VTGTCAVSSAEEKVTCRANVPTRRRAAADAATTAARRGTCPTTALTAKKEDWKETDDRFSIHHRDGLSSVNLKCKSIGSTWTHFRLK